MGYVSWIVIGKCSRKIRAARPLQGTKFYSITPRGGKVVAGEAEQWNNTAMFSLSCATPVSSNRSPERTKTPSSISTTEAKPAGRRWIQREKLLHRPRLPYAAGTSFHPRESGGPLLLERRDAGLFRRYEHPAVAGRDLSRDRRKGREVGGRQQHFRAA
jgi:hypothetical protein